MKIGDVVHVEYSNGEVVDGDIIQIREVGVRTLVTVRCEQGYRSVYLDKCDKFFTLENI